MHPQNSQVSHLLAQTAHFFIIFTIQRYTNMNKSTKTDLRRAFLATVPVMTGYIVLGMGFGMVLRTRGYGVLWALAMSVFIFAGSMQYVVIDLLTGGASLLTTALTTLAVNGRHLFYGISMVDRYKKQKGKSLLIFTLTDENFSLLCSDEGMVGVQNRNLYFLVVSLLNYGYWILGCTTGSLLGTVLPFSTEGIDFALTALFLTVFVEQWLSTKKHVAAMTGVLSAVICLLLLGPSRFLIPAMLLITLVLTLLRKKLDTPAPSAEQEEVSHDA